MSLLMGAVIAGLFAVPALLHGESWREAGSAQDYLIRAVTGAVTWFLIDLVQIGFRSRQRRRA
ncbi:hypothetical protein [Brevundimonas sp. UBA2416]|uniref:hypothetical protein n=1 Tax=Brevundimonas sp. UBA2416 TaxID=1946124 RepID=UPI0025C1C99D|nr:hypothetical protein [Brevundimonas sp. UBA2416]HRJ64302.1 hypothetical protein [Brevundimonas sp.]